MEQLKTYVDRILQNFAKANVYTYHPKDVTAIMNHLPEFGWILRKIIRLLEKVDLSPSELRRRLLLIKDRAGHVVLNNSLVDRFIQHQNYILKLLNSLASTPQQQKGGQPSPSDDFKKSESLLHSLFFPGTYIDRLPLGEEVLDLLSLFFENMDLIVEYTTPFVETGMEVGLSITMELIDFILDLGEAIPGAGTAIAAISIAVNITQPFIEFVAELFIKAFIQFLNSYSDILHFMLSLSRKNYNSALEEFSEILPVTEKLYTYLEDNMPLINKYVSKNNTRLQTLLERSGYYQAVIKHFIGRMMEFRNLFVTKKLNSLNPDTKID